MNSVDEVKEIIKISNSKTNFAHYVSTESIPGDLVEYYEGLEKIFTSLEVLGFDVHYERLITPGEAMHSFTGEYKKRDGVHGVFVDVPCEGENCGKVCISSSIEKIESLKGKIEESLGLEFKII